MYRPNGQEGGATAQAAGGVSAKPPVESPAKPPVDPSAKAPTKTEKAAKPDDEQQFTRLSRDANRQPVALETAIVTYASPDRDPAGRPSIWWPRIHVADASYYDRLNDEFAKYDVVLYELVAPEGTKVVRGLDRPTNIPSP